MTGTLFSFALAKGHFGSFTSESVEGHALFDASEPHVKPLLLDGQSPMIDPQTVQYRGIQVPDVHRILYDVIAEIVCRTVGGSGLNASPGQPD